MNPPNPPFGSSRILKRNPFASAVEILKPAVFSATTVDLGSGGLGLLAPNPLPQDSEVLLGMFGGRAIFMGTVRWCQAAQNQFRIGLQFHDESDVALIGRIYDLQEESEHSVASATQEVRSAPAKASPGASSSTPSD